MIYVVITAGFHEQVKTVMVAKEYIEENGYDPEDFFPPTATDVRILGEVEIIGDDTLLDSVYEVQ